MIDHRRAQSRRAYSLPGWFFLLTTALSVLGFALAGWILVANPFDAAKNPVVAQPTPTAAVPTPTPTQVEVDRDGIGIEVFNASTTPGIAKRAGEEAKELGWTVDKVENWTYGAAQNAVYFPDGHRKDAQALADDLKIDLIRPAKSGMSSDNLTVILITEP
jgi:hypothetical protein